MRPAIFATLMLLALAGRAAAEQAPAKPEPAPIPYAEPRSLANLANKNVSESSGVAVSRRNDGAFWTHNDSGDTARLYAFNAKGDDLGTFELNGVQTVDWEDIASFTSGGKHYLLAADVGDNAAQRKTSRLYIVEEPVIKPAAKPAGGRLAIAQTIEFQYDDGSHNCEGVAVDPASRTIFLVSKTVLPWCKVYELPFPKAGDKGLATAKPIATLKLPMTTAMDMSPDGLRCVVLTYGSAYEFTRRAGETWKQAFDRAPRTLSMPIRKQGESICFGADGKTLYLTSEGTPCPLWEVPVAPAAQDK